MNVEVYQSNFFIFYERALGYFPYMWTHAFRGWTIIHIFYVICTSLMYCLEQTIHGEIACVFFLL